MELALMLTRRCNAQCTHCAPDCGPHQRDALPAQMLFELMDQAAALAEPGNPLVFALTGGEAFLDLPLLLDVIRKGAALGGYVSVVSNAYWASSAEKADAIARQLREAGLKTLAVSTSRYHQQFVKLERVARAIAAARAAGMYTQLKIVYSVQDRKQGMVKRWSALAGADQTQEIPLMPYLREGAQLPEQDYPRRRGLPRGGCPSSIFAVKETGTAYACCTPGGFVPTLQIGDVYESQLDQLVDRYHFDPLLRLLRDRGPSHIARFAIARGHGDRLRSAYADVCDLCTHIASDPVLSQCAHDDARAQHRRWARGVARSMLREALPPSDREAAVQHHQEK